METNTSAKAHDIRLNSHSFLEERVFSIVEDYIAGIEKSIENLSVQYEKIELHLDSEEGLIGDLDLKESIVNQLDVIFKPVLNSIEQQSNSRLENVSIEKITDVSRDENKTQEAELLHPEVRLLKSVIHFLQTGKAPWWVSTHEELRKMLETKSILTLIDKQREAFASALIRIMKRPVVRRRLVRQFTPDVVILLLKTASQKLTTTIITEELNPLLERPELHAEIKKLQPSVLMFVFNVLIEEFYPRVSSNSAEFVQEINLPESFVILLRKEAPKLLLEIHKKIEKTQVYQKSEDTQQKQKIDIKDSSERFTEPTRTDEEKLDGIITENTGLVILNPFIKPFFTNINLLEEDGSLNDPVLAAHILHYLATGQEEDFEFALIFEAFLCGLPIDEPLPKSVPLTKEIKDACQELLEAVLGHWKSLKSNSVPLLRNEFLQRQGKLILSEEIPRIVVERTGVDILLDKIPWSISMLRLPWRENMIYVEW